MKKNIISLLSLLICLFLIKSANAQLTVTPNLTANQLVDILVGGGVTYSNATYSGVAASRGSFQTGNTPTNLGLTSGIILSSGSVADAPGPHLNVVSVPNGTGGDPHLSSLVGGVTLLDACFLQFDFVPESDTIRFRYVFASDEYPSFVCSSFNDVFGFFLSGPNPNGGNYNFQNIALIPGTGLPVAINTVNSGQPGGGYNASGCTSLNYSQYYVNNGVGATIQYRGFTTVLTAWAVVTPCVQYTIKIAIADAIDRSFDSSVFLEENSFSSNAVSISANYSYAAVDTAAIRGCSDATVTFSTSQNVTSPLTINFNVSGSAISGVDYLPIPTSVTIPAGQNSVSFLIEPIFTGLPGPTVDVIITAQTSICSGLDSVVVLIINNLFLETQSKSNDTTICGSSADLFIQATGGIPPYTYLWSDGSSSNQTTVSPTQTTTYTVTVNDDCGQSHTDSIVVSVGTGYANTSPDTTICIGGTATLIASGGSSYLWSNGANTATINVQPTVTTDYYVTVNGACDGFDTVTVYVSPLPIITVKPPTQSICKGETASLVAGGGLSYAWSSQPNDPSLGSQNVNQSIIVAPNNTSIYTVTATDELGCVNTASGQIVITPAPVAGFYMTPKVVSILEPVIDFFDASMGAVSWAWYLEDGSTYNTSSFQHIFTHVGVYEVNLVVENQYGCVDSVTNFVEVRPNYTIYIPNAFTPNNDTKNDVFYVQGEGILEIEMYIYDRWGKLIFFTDDINRGWDGKINGTEAPEGVYFYIAYYMDGFKKRKMVNGNVTLIR